MLDCVASMSHFTPYKPMNVACSITSHIAFEIWTLDCEWAMLNYRSRILECKNER